MNECIMTVLVWILATAVAQRYRQIDTSENLPAVQQRSAAESELIFETKVCYNEGISLYYNKSSDWAYALKLETANSTRSAHLWRHPLLETRAQGIIQNVDCNEYRRFKFMMSYGNMTLWTTQTSGWERLFAWTDSAPLTTVFSHIHIHGSSARWKIYQIEHATEPNKITCINF